MTENSSTIMNDALYGFCMHAQPHLIDTLTHTRARLRSRTRTHTY